MAERTAQKVKVYNWGSGSSASASKPEYTIVVDGNHLILKRVDNNPFSSEHKFRRKVTDSLMPTCRNCQNVLLKPICDMLVHIDQNNILLTNITHRRTVRTTNCPLIGKKFTV